MKERTKQAKLNFSYASGCVGSNWPEKDFIFPENTS